MEKHFLSPVAAAGIISTLQADTYGLSSARIFRLLVKDFVRFTQRLSRIKVGYALNR